MTAQDHLTALNRTLAKLSSVRGELASVQKHGEKTVNELDALNAAENPDAAQVSMVESRLRGLHAKRTTLAEANAQAEADLDRAVNAAFNALGEIAQSSEALDAAAQAVLPWCNGSELEARKAALALPAFVDRTRQIGWLNLRRDKTETDEFAPLLIKFFESVIGATPVAEAVPA